MRIAIPILLLQVWANAAALNPRPSHNVKVCISGGGQVRFALGLAEGVASEIFSTIGVGLEWRHQVPHCKVDPRSEISIEITQGVPPERFPKALAYSNVPGDMHIEVFYNRVAGVAEPVAIPKVLGHVLAHEITHVLQGVARHSSSGVMKTNWEEHDFHDMFWKPLPFAPEDADLILRGLEKSEQEASGLARSDPAGASPGRQAVRAGR